jgi:hypothetical protein
MYIFTKIAEVFCVPLFLHFFLVNSLYLPYAPSATLETVVLPENVLYKLMKFIYLPRGGQGPIWAVVPLDGWICLPQLRNEQSL